MSDSASARPAVPWWLGGLLALLALSGLLRFGDAWPAIDYYQFWLVGRELREHPQANPYEDAARAELGRRGLAEARAQQRGQTEASLHLRVAEYRQQLEVYSTPLLYGTLGAIASGNYEQDKRLWQRGMLVLFALSVLLCARAFGFSWGASLACVAAFSLSSEPLLAELGNGNVNSVLLLSLCFALWAWSRNRYGLGAAALGLGVCFKPLLWLALVPIALRWATAREAGPLLRTALGGLLGGVIGVGLGAWLGGGLGLWAHWLAAARELSQAAQDYPDNFSPLARLWQTPPAWLASLAVLALSALRAVQLRRRVVRAPEACESLAFGALLCLAFSPLVWIHYLLLAVPLLIAVFATPSVWLRLLGLLASFCIASQPLTLLLGWREHSLRSLPVVLAVLALVLAGFFLSTQGPAPRQEQAR
jgi:hypothetical protein